MKVIFLSHVTEEMDGMTTTKTTKATIKTKQRTFFLYEEQVIYY